MMNKFASEMSVYLSESRASTSFNQIVIARKSEAFMNHSISTRYKLSAQLTQREADAAQ